MTYWQVASGDKTRDYSEVCLNFGIVCIGPGNLGPISNDTITRYKDIGEWSKIKPIIEVKEGDRIVLKKGRSIIQAVGEVIKYKDNVYNHSNCFSDVDGWPLEHFVKVRWKPIKIQFKNSTELLRLTMARLNKKSTIDQIEKEWNNTSFIDNKYDLIDSNNKPIEYSELEQVLVNYGLRIRDAENTSRTIEQIEKLANWYLNNKIKSTEHEIRTFLVIPFLEALGWSPQKIGIEVGINRKKMDIVLFEDNNRKVPKILIETKKMWDGSNQAIEQSKSYIKNNKQLDDVKNFVVTDGLRYWLYEKNNETDWIPRAYMNFLNKQRFYTSYPECEGMFGFIKHLIK